MTADASRGFDFQNLFRGHVFTAEPLTYVALSFPDGPRQGGLTASLGNGVLQSGERGGSHTSS